MFQNPEALRQFKELLFNEIFDSGKDIREHMYALYQKEQRSIHWEHFREFVYKVLLGLAPSQRR